MGGATDADEVKAMRAAFAKNHREVAKVARAYVTAMWGARARSAPAAQLDAAVQEKTRHYFGIAAKVLAEQGRSPMSLADVVVSSTIALDCIRDEYAESCNEGHAARDFEERAYGRD
jgi:hypothetical protein